jgi:dienelactone hydrolase
MGKHRVATWKRWCGAALLALAATVAAAGERHWVGEFRVGAHPAIPIVLHERAAPAVASVDLPAMGARDVPLTTHAADADGVRFQLDGPPGRFAFAGKERDGRVEGEVVHGDASGRFELVEVAAHDPAVVRAHAGSYEFAPGHVVDIGPMDEVGGALVFLDQRSLRTGPLQALSATRFATGPSLGVPYPFAAQVEFLRDARGATTGLRWREGDVDRTARRIAPHRVEAVAVRNGDVTLHGTLLVPDTKGPHPAIVLAHGSGDATRDAGPWNIAFVRMGFAVLSLDKRGAGASGGDWHTASLDDIAGDWLAGVDLLRARGDIDPARIGVHGSSQGGWTAARMAARDPRLAFVIVRAGSGVSVYDQMAYEVGWSVREAGLDAAAAAEAEAASRGMFDLAIRGAPWAETAAFAAHHVEAPWFAHAWPLQMSEDGWGRRWVAKNAGYDATRDLARSRMPVLWFLGELDHNVPVDASERALRDMQRASGRPGLTVVRLPGTGHAFTATATGDNRSVGADSRFVAGYWDRMQQWLQAQGILGGRR